MRGLLAVILLAGCGRVSFDLEPVLPATPSDCETTDLPAPATLATVTVEPRYPAAPRWNDYVKTADTAQPCAGDEPDARDCLHGGELLRVHVPSHTSCEGLTLIESLDVFEWACDDTAGVVFHTLGLAPHRGLSDLVDAGGWLDNHVTVLDRCAPVAASTPAAWWTNTVRSIDCLPEPGGTSDPTCVPGVAHARRNTSGPTQDGYELTEEGTVYVVSTDRTSSGLFLAARGTSLVVMRGRTLRYQHIGDADNCTTHGSVGQFRQCLFSTGTQSFVWAEGRFDGNGDATYAVNASSAVSRNASFVTLRNIYATGAGMGANHSGVFLQALKSSRISHVTAAHNPNSGTGIRLFGACAGNVLRNLVAAENAQRGVHFNSRIGGQLERNDLSGLVAVHNGDAGLLLSSEECNSNMPSPECTRGASVDSTFTDIVTAFNGHHGVQVSNARQLTFGRITAVGNLSSGIAVRLTDDVTLFQLVVAGNDSGLEISNGARRALVAQTVSANNVGVAVELEADDVSFRRGLLLGANGGECTIRGTGLELLTDCSGPGIDVVRGLDLSSAFVGPLTQPPGPGTLWIPQRVEDGTEVWDHRLRAADRQLLDASGPATFVPGAACPTTGDDALTDSEGRTFLVDARELAADEVGDDDGLCESGERCVYSPNYGAYQGEGELDPLRSCSFEDGRVSGVTLLGYPVNGS